MTVALKYGTYTVIMVVGALASRAWPHLSWEIGCWSGALGFASLGWWKR